MTVRPPNDEVPPDENAVQPHRRAAGRHVPVPVVVDATPLPMVLRLVPGHALPVGGWRKESAVRMLFNYSNPSRRSGSGCAASGGSSQGVRWTPLTGAGGSYYYAHCASGVAGGRVAYSTRTGSLAGHGCSCSHDANTGYGYRTAPSSRRGM